MAVKDGAIVVSVMIGLLISIGGLIGGYSLQDSVMAFFAVIGAFMILYYISEKVSELIKLKKKARGGQN